VKGSATFLAVLASALLLSPRPATADCTNGVASGQVTTDGRPLLWKSRVAGGAENQVYRFEGRPYSYLAIRSAGTIDPMMGVNSAGLSLGNTLVGMGGFNGAFMHHVLLNFATVDEVREYIEGEYAQQTLQAEGCFPFADAHGNATLFEINHKKWFLEYDCLDPDRAWYGLHGWVVRANEWHQRADGTDNRNIGGRYLAGRLNIAGLIGLDRLSAFTVMQGDDGATGFEFMRYGPGRTLETIAVPGVCSSMVVHGVRPGEDPQLSTMWSALGHADYAIAVPTWVAVEVVPDVLGSGELALLANALRDVGDERITQASVFPVERHLFEEVEELARQWRQSSALAVHDMPRVEGRMAEDAYSLLFHLLHTQADNRAPVVELRVSAHGNGAGNGFPHRFEARAADVDGRVIAYGWRFGDGHTATGAAPGHAFDRPGRYLVSCTVTDDDGVSSTDWQYLLVPGQP